MNDRLINGRRRCGWAGRGSRRDARGTCCLQTKGPDTTTNCWPNSHFVAVVHHQRGGDGRGRGLCWQQQGAQARYHG